MMKIKLPSVSKRKERVSVAKLRTPAWYKASQEDKDLYHCVLTEKLGEQLVPESIHCKDYTCESHVHTEERDQHVLDILCTIIETSYQCIPVSSNLSRPSKAGPPLPGWKETIAPLESDSKFWHSVCLVKKQTQKNTIMM